MNENKEDYSVLVVEDDPIIARVLETMLRDKGFRVDEPVNSGEKAIFRAALRKPGIALMDIDLVGRLSGIETARILLHIFSIPVIFVTGHDEEQVLVRAKEADPFGFLVKPINQHILNTTIQVAVNLIDKICTTAEGKMSGLNERQRLQITDSLIPVLLLDEKNRIIWMNNSAEYLVEQQASDLILSDATKSLVMIDPDSQEPVNIFNLDPIEERPLLLSGTHHKKLVIPRIFMINDPFGDIGGYFIELAPDGDSYFHS